MPEANRPQPRNLPTNLDAYAHLLRAKVEQLATVLTDLADVVERCPDAFSRLHLRNLVDQAHQQRVWRDRAVIVEFAQT
jgi:hypothetical protein